MEREAQKVISLRETLENVLERPVQTRATPRPARQETSARGMHVRPISEGPLGAPGAAAGPAPTVEVSDEAEVEIIALEPGHGVERDGKVAAGGAARAGVASAGVTAAVPRDQGGGNDGARGGGVDRDAYAGYHGHVDEAAVDIVPLDEPVADPAGDATTDAPSDEAPAQVAPGKKPPRSSGKE